METPLPIFLAHAFTFAQNFFGSWINGNPTTSAVLVTCSRSQNFFGSWINGNPLSLPAERVISCCSGPRSQKSKDPWNLRDRYIAPLFAKGGWGDRSAECSFPENPGISRWKIGLRSYFWVSSAIALQPITKALNAIALHLITKALNAIALQPITKALNAIALHSTTTRSHLSLHHEPKARSHLNPSRKP